MSTQQITKGSIVKVFSKPITLEEVEGKATVTKVNFTEEYTDKIEPEIYYGNATPVLPKLQHEQEFAARIDTRRFANYADIYITQYAHDPVQGFRVLLALRNRELRLSDGE